MKTAEIRSRFLEYFKAQGHTVVESSSLVPSNDPTLLFTNAGMVQFKDVFLGKDKRPYSRATTSQKCVRAGGKHNDLENVGFTARHHTFFEMLGNFSFGDYFKKDAIRFAWQFVTEELKLPKDRLYVTVFETDDEAAEIWHEQEGVAKDRIYRFGEKDNFWSMGDTGPCGPCSEIFIDRGAKYSCGKPTCGMGCDCDRYMEFWNLVFMQYDRSSDGKLTPLPKPSVDTGAGLERIASIIQDVDTNYDTDLFKGIISKISDLAKVPYYTADDNTVSFRVIADHSRATAFLVGDGVMPSNEGRGYVLRRIMRRAIRHGKKLGFTGPFLHKTIGFVIDEMAVAYPDLIEKRTFIEKAVLAEEEQFFKTLERGISLLDEEIAKAKARRASMLAGETAFKLYDSFGFPLDLTRVICAENGLGIDEAGFEKSMDRQRAESRKNWKGTGQSAIDAIYLNTANELRETETLPKFTGYEKLSDQGKCIKLFLVDPNGAKAIQEFQGLLESNQVLEAVFSNTPFYAESGGQAGDQGKVSGPGFEALVTDVQKPAPDLIVVQLKPLFASAKIKVGETYHQEVDGKLRALTASNHTATHLLHWALRKILGTHVKQAGSLVNADLLRFDFSHFQALTAQELRAIEDLVNEKIWSGDGVQKREMKKDAALSLGAIAMFGEKYGDDVRVISVGDYSTEFCGGTHVNASSDIHCFKIESETGIAAGVRRIIALSSTGAFRYLRGMEDQMKALKENLKAGNLSDVPVRVEKLQVHAQELKKKLELLEGAKTSQLAQQLIHTAVAAPHGTLIVHELEQDPNREPGSGMKVLRELADLLRNQASDSLVVLGVREGDKAQLIVASGAKTKSPVNASQIFKELAAKMNGKGGGKPDFAQGGGDGALLTETLAHAKRSFAS